MARSGLRYGVGVCTGTLVSVVSVPNATTDASMVDIHDVNFIDFQARSATPTAGERLVKRPYETQRNWVSKTLRRLGRICL
jgi:hypothetical protein